MILLKHDILSRVILRIKKIHLAKRYISENESDVFDNKDKVRQHITFFQHYTRSRGLFVTRVVILCIVTYIIVSDIRNKSMVEKTY